MANLIDVKRTGFIPHSQRYRFVGNNVFEAIFDAAPTSEDIVSAQIKAGYHPSGYGGYSDLATRAGEGGRTIATFQVSNNSD